MAEVRRPDFSDGLVHLTRERKEYEEATEPFDRPKVKRKIAAFDVLKEILVEGKINGSGNDGYVKGHRKVVCFSEVPLSAVQHFASPPDAVNARYRYYGISVSKKALFNAGGRPVIYLPDRDATWIPAEEKWRHVRFDYGKVDFTHEREWRIPDELKLQDMPGLYVLVWSATEAKEVQSLQTPLKPLIRGVLPMQHLTKFL